ncbi:MAG TPA: hypothetical protein PK228_19815 [Saprospiraceae bacterium]|nr:hypothetical protein [Saprospiraceae bacterium]
MKKSELLALIAADEIRPALDVAGESARLLENNDLRENMVLLTSQWENLEKEEQSGTVAWETLQQNRNRVKRSLLDLLATLPELLPVTRDVAGHAKPSPVKPGIEEGKFKRQIFFFMLAAKCWIIYWILFHKGSGGFTSGEAMATISLLLPAFTAYTTVMLGDFIKNRNKPAIPTAFLPRVSRTLSTITWLVFPAYVLALHWIIGEKAAGTLADDPQANYESMTGWLAVVESAFGIYVGQIINEVFKNEVK